MVISHAEIWRLELKKPKILRWQNVPTRTPPREPLRELGKEYMSMPKDESKHLCGTDRRPLE